MDAHLPVDMYVNLPLCTHSQTYNLDQQTSYSSNYKSQNDPNYCCYLWSTYLASVNKGKLFCAPKYIGK